MENDSFVYVYVCGAVNTPSVVKLLLGSRAQAAVEAAGGFREDADIDAVNLAAFVEDAQCLDIPTIEESILKEKEFQNTKDGIVNLNTADSSQLTTLPGIGESRAQDIIAYREEYGEFVVIEDIMKVPGIKESAFAKIKSKITVG
jgi:competence protein ComEA